MRRKRIFLVFLSCLILPTKLVGLDGNEHFLLSNAGLYLTIEYLKNKGKGYEYITPFLEKLLRGNLNNNIDENLRYTLTYGDFARLADFDLTPIHFFKYPPDFSCFECGFDDLNFEYLLALENFTQKLNFAVFEGKIFRLPA